MTETQFKKFILTWCERAVDRGVAAEADFIRSVATLDSKPPSSALSGIFRELLIDMLTVQMRQRWGGAERIELDGAPGVRGMIPVDEIARRETMAMPARLLARAQRAYFDE